MFTKKKDLNLHKKGKEEAGQFIPVSELDSGKYECKVLQPASGIYGEVLKTTITIQNSSDKFEMVVGTGIKRTSTVKDSARLAILLSNSVLRRCGIDLKNKDINFDSQDNLELFFIKNWQALDKDSKTRVKTGEQELQDAYRLRLVTHAILKIKQSHETVDSLNHFAQVSHETALALAIEMGQLITLLDVNKIHGKTIDARRASNKTYKKTKQITEAELIELERLWREYWDKAPLPKRMLRKNRNNALEWIIKTKNAHPFKKRTQSLTKRTLKTDDEKEREKLKRVIEDQEYAHNFPDGKKPTKRSKKPAKW